MILPRPVRPPPTLARTACARAAVANSAKNPQREKNARLLTRVLTSSEPLLLRQAQKHAQLDADAEEALQSACVLFIERFQAERFEPLPWLQTTIKREAWRLARRGHRRRELGITAVPRNDGYGTADLSDTFADLDADSALVAEAHELTRHRRLALRRLKPDQRTALLLFGLGYSYAEIAELRGWTYTKVNRCISEGRAALRACL